MPWESAGGSPRRGRRLRAEGDHPFGPLDEQPPRPTGQGGPLPHKEDQANLPGGPLERPDSSDKRVLTAPSMEQRQTDKYHSVAPPAQEKSTSQQLAVASPAQTHPPTPGSTPLHPSHPQQFTETYATQTVPPQTFIPQQVGTQPITPQSIPTPLSTDQYHVIASQHPPQTPLHQVQYQTPTGYTPGYQPFPQAPPLNKLELAKPKSVNEVQSSRQIEYEVASDHRVLHKTQLDEDVKTLVRRLQDMESTMHRRDLDAASRVSELEGSVSETVISRELSHCVELSEPYTDQGVSPSPQSSLGSLSSLVLLFGLFLTKEAVHRLCGNYPGDEIEKSLTSMLQVELQSLPASERQLTIFTPA